MSAVELSLFYFVNDVTLDGYVLWGEGIARSGPASQGMQSQNLGDGLRLMRVRGEFEDVARTLQQARFPYRRGRGITENLHFGFVRRPPIMAVPPQPTLRTDSAGVLHQFVRWPKSDAFGIERRPSEPNERAHLSRLLEGLARYVGIDFRDPKDAPFLGNVVIAEEDCLAEAPVELEGIKPEGGRAPEALRISIRPAAAGVELTVNVRLTGSDNAVLDDVLVQWRAGMPTDFELPVNQRFGGAEVRAWREGRLVWQTDLAFILEVGLNMSLVGRTILLQDRLTDLLKGSIQAGQAPASMLASTQRVVQQSHGNRSVVGANLREPWRGAALTAAREVYAISPPPPPAHEYFPQGGHGRARAIQAFVGLLQDKTAFLVDPFFDALGAEALLPRLERDANLTIVTSLPEATDVQQLRRYLEQAAPFLPFKLKIFRVTRRDSKEQAFHDRYLVMMESERPARGLLLSNSFSGAARQYPLVVAEMSSATTAAVLDDIEALLSHRNIESLWPPPPKPRAPHDPFGEAWRFYLQRLIPRLGRTQEDWLRAAKAFRWLDIDSDGQPRWGTERQTEVLDRVLDQQPRVSALRPSWPRWSARCRRRRSLRRGHPHARQPSLGLRVAAIGERAARGLEVTPEDVAGRLRSSAPRELETFIRADFRHPEQRDRRDAWLEGVGLHQAMTTTDVSLDVVRAGLALWGDTHAVQDLRQRWGRTFVYRVLLALDPDRAFRTGLDLGDPDFLVAVLDPWDVQPWRLALTRAAIHSRSPLVRALGAQSLVTPRERGNFSPRPVPPSEERLSKALVVLKLLDRPTAALCALEWGTRSGDETARRALAEVLLERLVDLSQQVRDEVFPILVANPSLLNTLADAVRERGGPSELLAEGLLRTIADTLDDRQSRNQAEAAPGVARILAQAVGASVEAGEQRLRAAFGVENATTCVTPISPFRRHPGWREAVTRLAWAQALCVLAHEECESDDGVPILVSLGLVAEVSPELVATIVAAHVPGLRALVDDPSSL